MESGERLASSSPSQSSIRSTAPPPEPSSNPNSKSGHLFQLMAEPGFGLSSSFPMLNHPVFRLYSSLSGGSHFGGLGTLGMPGAITPHPHPQLGPFPDWWRTADAQAHAAAALFPPVLGLPPLFTPPALNRSHSTSTKGLNGSANGKANSASSGASSTSSSPSPAFTAAEQNKSRKSALKTPNHSKNPNTGLNTPKSVPRTPNSNWKTKNKKEQVQEKESQSKQKNLCTTEICSNTDSQSGSSSDSETLSSLDSGDLENEEDEDEDEEGGESESEREQRVKKVQPNSCVSSTHPLFTSTPRQEHGKHSGIILTTGPRGKPKPSRDSQAPSKPLCLTLSPKLPSLSSSPKPRSLSSCPRPSSLKTSSRSSPDEHLTQDAFRRAFPTQLLERHQAAKSSQKANHHSNLFLSSSNSTEQDAPLALITKPRSRPSRPTASPSSAEGFNAPINLSTTAKSSELYSDQSTSRPMHRGAESDIQSSKDSEDSAEDEDDAEEDEKDDSLSDSSSNLDTESDDDDSDDSEGNDEELNTDPESPAAPPLRKLSKSPVKVQNAPAQPPVTSSTPSASFILTPPTGSGKRRRVMDEQELQRPLQYGWQRETRIRNISGRVQGEVAYYAPCGKKLKQYPDVIKYLARSGISEITRDNFSFSTKIRVGDFYEAREGPEGSQWCLLKEDEVLVRVLALERQRGRAQRPDGHHRKRKSSSAGGASDAKVLRRTEAQEIARQATQMKLMRKLEKQALTRAAKEAKRQQALLVAEEKRKQKEQLKILKQQEKMRRVEQIRMEKELRAQQILEAKRKKKEEAANAKLLEAEKRIKEKELRRQQAILLKHQELERHRLDMERERRRQHTMLVKAVEARKKAEERERIKQEKRDEKRLNKERKLELRRLELELEKELNRPNEDMCLIDQQALPDLSRVPGLLLPASCLADCLMVMQFLRCFGKVLRLDVAPPTLNMLQAGLLNLNPGAGQLQDLLIRLLSAAVCDPGLPPGQRAKTALGEHISSVDINRENVSEILQIFMAAHCGHTELSALAESLRTKPFQAHTPSQKASVLAFMVNELACSKSIVTEIDKNIEHMANQRREKWVVERNLRKLRSIHTKRTGKADCTAGAEAVGTPTAGRKRKKKAESEDDDEEDDDSDEGELDEDEDEEGGKKGKKADEEDEDQTASVEELEKQIEKLTKQQLQIRRKLFESSHSLRSMMLGQDRYKRRYWVLPQCGGVFVESMESGEGPQEVERERERLQNPVKDEPTEVPLHKPFGSGSPGTSEADPQKEKDSLNLFLQKPDSFSKLSQLLDVVKTSPSAPLSTPNNPEAPLLFTCKQDGKSDVALSPAPLALGGRRFHSEQLQLYRALSERNAHWFSLLPRSPCDHGSLTTTKTKGSSGISGASSNPALPLKPLQIKPDVHLTTLLFSHQHTGSISPNRICADPSTSAPSKTESPGPPEEKKIRNRDLMTPNPIPQDMLTGWWKVSSSEELGSIMKACHPRGIRERVLQKQIQKHTDYLLQTCAKNREASLIDVSELKHSGVCEGTVQCWSVEDRTMVLDVAVLQQVEELVHKVTCASLHIKSWKPPEPQSERDDLLYYEHKATNDGENETKPKSSREIVRRGNNPLDIAVEQLWDLEQNIERRYLKSPLNGTLQISVDNLGTVRVPATAPTTGAEGNGGEEDVAPGMRQWRKALSEVRSGAQLSLCLQQLQRSIAWERSIMKVYCQICHKGDNEDLLLLCDGCDKGCHTYCHKPQISSIPEGDWFCPACRATACLSPLKVKKQAVEKPPETKPNTTPSGAGEGSEEDTASSGTSSTSKKRGKGPNKRKMEERVNADAPLQEAPPRAKKAKTARDNNKDLELCRFLLAELQSHQDAWPFMSPVNPKSVPGYRKVIKKPMDFSTIREKLSNSQYLNLEMFIIDVNLVFENCEMFNEDDSDIGRAGHSMRRFFQRRWTELLKQIH